MQESSLRASRHGSSEAASRLPAADYRLIAMSTYTTGSAMVISPPTGAMSGGLNVS
jgi:hypothetical protein